jgi:hypothetical protein
MFHDHNFTMTTFLGIFMITLGAVGPRALESVRREGPRLSETTLASTTGADPSKAKDKTGVNCGFANAEAKNGANPPPNPIYVDSNQCNETVPVNPPTDPPQYTWKYMGNPCIQCPVVLQSMTVKGPDIQFGYVKVGEQPCQVAPERGTKGTCANGACINTAPYDCDEALKIYQRQSGSGGGGPP